MDIRSRLGQEVGRGGGRGGQHLYRLVAGRGARAVGAALAITETHGLWVFTFNIHP